MVIKTIPALIVGLGGTGKRALTHIKRRILDTYGVPSLPWVRLLSIDADNAEVNSPPVISQISGDTVQLENFELRVIDQSNTPLIISNLDSPENRHIKDWYPDKERNVDFPKAVRGSGQIRMFGRAGLYKDDNLHNTFNWLKEAAQSISDPTVGADYPNFSIDSSLQFIYVICSLCGGTGSGIFLDVAYMLRKIVGAKPETRRMVGALVLPEVYETVVQKEQVRRIQANSYAALRELDFLMHSPRRQFKISGKNDTLVDFQRDIQPFDFVFLFGNKNKQGAIISDRAVGSDKPTAPDDRVAQYISEAIVTDVVSPVTTKSESLYSNIFTQSNEPVKSPDGRVTYHKTFCAVGISSVKILPVEHYRELLIAKISDLVIDFLLRPDPDVTERRLAEQFFSANFSDLGQLFALNVSLNEDPDYKEFSAKDFAEQFADNEVRPQAWDMLRQWVETIARESIDLDSPLDVESQAVVHWREKLQRANTLVLQSLQGFRNDPTKGFTFMREWIEELIRFSEIRRDAIDISSDNDFYQDRFAQALRALETVEGSLIFAVERDSVFTMLWRLGDYYNNHLRAARSANLAISLYNAFIAQLQIIRTSLLDLEQVLNETDRQHEQLIANRIERMPDTARDAILVDKSLVGKHEIASFLNFLLTPLWEGGNWEQDFPDLSQHRKSEITSELGYRLLEIALDANLTTQERRAQIVEATRAFVEQRIFSQLFPMEARTGKLQAPRYTTSDGKSVLFKFAPSNLLALMGRHSSPLWSVQTHQIASATSPIQFLGLNGSSLPENLLSDLQKHINTNFKNTDIVLADDEPRLLIKQYDPLYSLASLESIQDYETRYKATDRAENPLHIDIRFMAEPNPYLQLLTYQAPPPPRIAVCREGHDIEDALKEGREYCPHCSAEGRQTYIIAGKKLCPKCNKPIAEDSLLCPEPGCDYLFIAPKKTCRGCQTLHKEPARVVEYKDAAQKQPKENFCPTCNSLWANQCPYCNAPLDNLTKCTRGEKCIIEKLPIVQCANCECSVRPDATQCPRCFEKLKECPTCKTNHQAKRMIAQALSECPTCHTAMAKA